MQSIQNRSHLYKTPQAAQDNGVLPPGIYHACLDAVQRLKNAYGNRYSFVFRITEGRYAGDNVTLSTTTKLNRNSKLGLTVKAMLGRDLTASEKANGFNPVCLAGMGCRVLTTQETTRSGKVYATVDRILT